MTRREFGALLRRANRIAREARNVQQEVTEAFRARYGVTHSDVDADSLIDSLDYGEGDAPTVAECDAEMLEHGYPARDSDQAA